MNRSKKIFLAAAVVFFIIIGYFGFDIARRTAFPNKERLQQIKQDSVQRRYDSLNDIRAKPNEQK